LNSMVPSLISTSLRAVLPSKNEVLEAAYANLCVNNAQALASTGRTPSVE